MALVLCINTTLALLSITLAQCSNMTSTLPPAASPLLSCDPRQWHQRHGHGESASQTDA